MNTYEKLRRVIRAVEFVVWHVFLLCVLFLFVQGAIWLVG